MKARKLKKAILPVCGVLVATAMSVSAPSEKVDVSQDPVVRAVQKVLPAVVNIGTTRLAPRQFRDPFEELFSRFFGRKPGAPFEPQEQVHSLGSGVIVESSGFIITNEHLVQRASKISVKLNDGTQYDATYLVGDAKNDLALLKIDPKSPLQDIELLLDREPLLGETVIAVGNPLGLEHTVTKGVLSSKNRKYEWEGKVVFDDILQTDAAINPGNSGGPLVDLNGQLVGINIAVVAEAHGIGFAIPVKRVAMMLADWFSPEKSKKLWVGVKWKQEEGRIFASDVQPDSPAAKAGVRAGDVVERLDGVVVTSMLDLQKKLLQKNAGDAADFSLRRGTQAFSVRVKPVPLPKPDGLALAKQKLGLSLQEITAELAGRLMLTAGRGLLVADVAQDTEAWRAGVRRGMVVLSVNDREVNKLDDVGEALKDVKKRDKVNTVIRARSQQGPYIWEQTVNLPLTAQ